MPRPATEPDPGGSTGTLGLSLVRGDTVEAWGDSEVRWFFREAHRLGVPAPTSLALLAHHRRGMLGFCRLWWTSFHEGLVERPLTEEFRVRIATQAGCAYCATSRLEVPAAPSGAMPATAFSTAGAGVGGRRRAALLEFGDVLSLRPWDLGSGDWSRLRAAFSEAEVVELAAFAAWQVSGPRMLRSWGAERFKDGARVDPARLPVRLAYAVPVPGDEPAAGPRPRPRGGQPPLGSAPAGWLAFLEPRPDLAAAWADLWVAAIDDGPLPPRIGQLVRLDLATRLGHRRWAPLDDSAILAAGIDRATAAALPTADSARFDARERAALAYARALLADHALDEAAIATLTTEFSEAELVQLGLATAVQIGAILVDRSRSADPAGPIAMIRG